MSAQLDLLVECTVPPAGSQCHRLLSAMLDGVRLTIWNAMHDYQVGALSQRIGNLKHIYGWGRVIKTRTIDTPNGAHIAEYWIDRCDVPPR